MPRNLGYSQNTLESGEILKYLGESEDGLFSTIGNFSTA